MTSSRGNGVGVDGCAFLSRAKPRIMGSLGMNRIPKPNRKPYHTAFFRFLNKLAGRNHIPCYVLDWWKVESARTARTVKVWVGNEETHSEYPTYWPWRNSWSFLRLDSANLKMRVPRPVSRKRTDFFSISYYVHIIFISIHIIPAIFWTSLCLALQFPLHAGIEIQRGSWASWGSS